MIKYHGTPISGSKDLAPIFLQGRCALVSFAHPEQLEVVIGACNSFIFDNGAFTAWKQGTPIADWSAYYDWVELWMRHPGFDWAVIPDVIDGSEADNDRLIAEWKRRFCERPYIGVPVWHFHESPDRLTRLAYSWPRVALGSSGEYSDPGSDKWRVRMDEAMSAVCDDTDLRPVCKLHLLRGLDPDVFRDYPLASADSTNCGQNGQREAHKMGLSCAAAGAVWIDERRISAYQSAPCWRPMPKQARLFGEVA